MYLALRHKLSLPPQPRSNGRAFNRRLKQVLSSKRNATGGTLHIRGPTTANDLSPTRVLVHGTTLANMSDDHNRRLASCTCCAFIWQMWRCQTRQSRWFPG